jgi:hypothetical protein
MILSRLPFARESLPDFRRALFVDWRYSAQQRIRGNLQVLREQGKIRHTTRVESALNVADGLPVQTDKLRKALLRGARFKARCADIAADDAEHLGLGHGPCCEA